MTISSGGNVGIGTTNPGAKLEVAGQIKMTGSTPGAGKVLTSDAVGLATWETPSVGTVTSVGLSMPSQFAVTGSPVTTSGTLAAAWNVQVANVVLAGPVSGGAVIPTFRALIGADIPDLSGTYSVIGHVHSTMVTTDTTQTISGQKTFSSTTYFQSGDDSVYIGQPEGATGRGLAIHTRSSTNIIEAYHFESGWVQKFYLTAAGAGYFAGQLKIAGGIPGAGKVLTSDAVGLATWETPSVGTVTSVGLSLPSNEFNITISPITGSGTLTAVWYTQVANIVFAGPASGSPVAPGFRA
jgi:hypothetical protein